MKERVVGLARDVMTSRGRNLRRFIFCAVEGRRPGPGHRGGDCHFTEVHSRLLVTWAGRTDGGHGVGGKEGPGGHSRENNAMRQSNLNLLTLSNLARHFSPRRPSRSATTRRPSPPTAAPPAAYTAQIQVGIA